MPETITIPETVSLPSETVIKACAELRAVEDLLTRLWGHQDGGDGNIADRIGEQVGRLLFAAFPELRDSGSVGEDLSAVVDAKSDEILGSWISELGKARIAELSSP